MTAQFGFDARDMVDAFLVGRAKAALRREYLALSGEIDTYDSGWRVLNDMGLLARRQRRIQRYVKYLRAKGEEVPEIPEWAWGGKDAHYRTHKLA